MWSIKYSNAKDEIHIPVNRINYTMKSRRRLLWSTRFHGIYRAVLEVFEVTLLKGRQDFHPFLWNNSDPFRSPWNSTFKNVRNARFHLWKIYIDRLSSSMMNFLFLFWWIYCIPCTGVYLHALPLFSMVFLSKFVIQL